MPPENSLSPGSSTCTSISPARRSLPEAANLFFRCYWRMGSRRLAIWAAYLDSLLKLRHEIERGQLQAPRIFFAGPYLDGNPPFFQPSLVVTNSAEAAADIHSLTVAAALILSRCNRILAGTLILRSRIFAAANISLRWDTFRIALRRRKLPMRGRKASSI